MLLKSVKLYRINSSGGGLGWIWRAKKLWSGNINLNALYIKSNTKTSKSISN